MTVLGFILLLVIAAIAGAAGQALAGWSRGGLLAAVAVGFVGAYLGLWISQQLHLPELLTIKVDGQSFPVIWAIIGSAILAGLLSLLSGYRTRRRI